MADTTLRMVVEGDTQDAEQALARTADAADDAGERVDDAGSRMDRGLSRAGDAMGEAEDKAEGFAYMLTGAASAGLGFSQIMEGDVFAGTVMMAMGIADLAQGISKFAIPAIKAMTVENIKSTAAKAKDMAVMAAHKVQTLASAAATTVWTAATKGLNAAWRANPIGIVITVVMALVAAIIYAYKHSETFRNIVDTGLKVVAAAFKFLWDGAKAALSWISDTLTSLGDSVRGALVAAFRFMVNAVLGYFGLIIEGAAKLFGWVPGVGGKLETAAREFRNFRDKVNAALGGIQDQDVNVNIRVNRYGEATGPSGKERASGGPVWPGLWLVGEEGPELLDLRGGNGYVYNNSDTEAMMAGASSGRPVFGGGSAGATHIHIHTPAVITSDRQLLGLIEQAKRRVGAAGTFAPSVA